MSQVRLDFIGRVSPVEKKVYVVSSAVSATTEGTRRKLRFGRIRREFSCDK